VLVDLRPHWLFLSGPLASTMVAVAVAIARHRRISEGPDRYRLRAGRDGCGPILWFGIRTIKWLGVSLVITNERVIYRRGSSVVTSSSYVFNGSPRFIARKPFGAACSGRGAHCGTPRGDPMVIADVGHPRVVQRVLNDQLTQISHGALLDGGGTRASGVPPIRSASPDRSLSTSPHPMGFARGYSVGERSSPPPSASASLHDQLIQLDDLRRRGSCRMASFKPRKPSSSAALRRTLEGMFPPGSTVGTVSITRYRCTACGNLTRFDVVTTRRREPSTTSRGRRSRGGRRRGAGRIGR